MAEEQESQGKYGTINLKYTEILEETDSDVSNKQTKTTRQVTYKDINEFEFMKVFKELLQIYDVDVTFKLKVPPEDKDEPDDEE